MNLEYRCFRHTLPLCILLCCLCAAVFVCPVSPASALELQELSVDNRDGRIMVRFGVAASDLNRVARTVESGERAMFLALGTLYRAGDLGGEVPIMYGSFESNLTWDPERLEYILSLPELDEPLRSRRLEEILARGWSQAALDMGAFQTLEPGAEYNLKLDFRLERPDVPEWKKNLFFFLSWDADCPESCELSVAY